MEKSRTVDLGKLGYFYIENEIKKDGYVYLNGIWDKDWVKIEAEIELIDGWDDFYIEAKRLYSVDNWLIEDLKECIKNNFNEEPILIDFFIDLVNDSLNKIVKEILDKYLTGVEKEKFVDYLKSNYNIEF